MVVDVIIPVYRPEREKLTKLIDWLNKQTVKPSHVFFMQTLVEEKEVEEVLEELIKLNIRDNSLIEVSGGITAENIVDYAKLGIDIISLGALTHSSRSLNFSLRILED